MHKKSEKPEEDGSETMLRFCTVTVGLISLLVGDVSVERITGNRGEALNERPTIKKKINSTHTEKTELIIQTKVFRKRMEFFEKK